MAQQHTSSENAAVTRQLQGLENIEKRDTIGDRISKPALQAELPAGWTPRLEMVNFDDAMLEEVILLKRTASDPHLYLKPATMTEPTHDIEWYERSTPANGHRYIRTIDTLDEALRAAINWAHQHDD